MKKKAKKILTCDYCRKRKKDARVTIDPYRADVWDENIEVTICDNCYQERVHDV